MLLRRGVALCVVLAALLGCSQAVDDQPAVGFVDSPLPEQWDSEQVRIEGWVFDPDTVVSVEAILNGEHVFSTRPDLKRTDVLQAHPHIDTPTPGFAIEADLSGLLKGQDVLAVYSVDANGGRTPLGQFDWAGSEPPAWHERAAQVAGWDLEPFYVPVATSGLTDPQVKEFVSVYKPYQNDTFKFGLRVPVLYMRTTKGRAHDWVFDPDFDTRMRGESGKLIAEDALNQVLATAVKHRIPLLLTLNGGIWADAAGTEPEWDLIDHLEEDIHNCQWTQDGQVFADDYLSNLPGSTLSPELSRALTLNVFADEVRRYKKRNLQQAATIVAEFARQHPDLFIGVNLDPDVYINPFFEGKAWFDYNPDTVRQFRHWLSGTGPYAEGGILQGEHLIPALTLEQVNALSGRRYAAWDEVQAPRLKKGAHENPWQELWGQFRRHLVYQHYNDMANWVGEVGIDPYKIFTAQGFAATSEQTMPMPIHIMSPGRNYDTAGMSIEGSKPENGHLGAILYGDSATDRANMENDLSLFANIQHFDLDWGVPEFSLADISKPLILPDYAVAYAAALKLLNSNVRYVSPMAWNGSNGIFAGQEGFVSYTSWRNTPAELAFMDFALAREGLGRSVKFWPFGFRRVATVDGWVGSGGNRIEGRNGFLFIEPPVDGTHRIISPEFRSRYDGDHILVVKFKALDDAARVKFSIRDVESRALLKTSPDFTGAELAGKATLNGNEWVAELPQGSRIAFEIEFETADPVVIDHVAIIPVAAQ